MAISISTPIVLALLVALALHEQPVAASQEREPATARPLTVGLTLLPSSNVAVRKALLRQFAQLGEPSIVSRGEAETDEAIVRRMCGFVSSDLLGIFRLHNAADQDPVAEGHVRVPACPFWEFDKPVVAARKGREGALDLMAAHMGLNGPISQRLFLAANPKVGSLDAVVSGQALVMPYSARRVSIILNRQLRNGPGSVRAFVNQFANLVIGRPGEPNDVELVRDVSPASAAAPDLRCTTPGASGLWPYDRQAVGRVLLDFIHAPNGGRLQPVTVVVGDTGIDASDVGRLPMYDNPGERGNKERNGRDDDGDRFIDNRYGGLVDPPQGAPGRFPQRDAEYDRALHGLHVAALAAGGLTGDSLDDLIKPVLRIAMANLVRRHATAAGVDFLISETGLLKSLILARRFRAGVVNWSVSSTRPMQALEDALSADALPLVVVAAGNDGLELDRLGVFPAGYVRTLKERIIVVGAHGTAESSREPIEWSNWGRDVVDLLAPGCEVGTISEGGIRAAVNGTSFAAPLVSFAAALLHAQGIEQPGQIKARLMSTVDSDIGLEAVVRSAGTLNIARALAVHKDVVEVTVAGQRTMSLGTITWDTSTLSLCGESIRADDIVRVIPRYAADTAAPMLVQWSAFEEGSGRLIETRRERCAVEDISLQFLATGAAAPVRLRLSDITDLVPRLR